MAHQTNHFLTCDSPGCPSTTGQHIQYVSAIAEARQRGWSFDPIRIAGHPDAVAHSHHCDLCVRGGVRL